MTSPEKVNVTLHKTASICLLNALAEHTPRDKLLELYQPTNGEVEVELRVNGHIVPFVPTIENLWEQLRRDQHEIAWVHAKDALNKIGFDAIAATLGQLRQQIEQHLVAKHPEVFTPTKRSEDEEEDDDE